MNASGERLILDSLHIENIGPYLGKQDMTFSPDGVTIIYAINGGGKTSLLRTLSLALYGRMLGRHAKIPLHKLLNTEARQQSNRQGIIELTASVGADKYRFNCQITSHTNNPKSDADIDVRHVVLCNDIPLGPGAKEAALQRLLPSEISQFFIFDGETLQEYKQLLDNDWQASLISNSIDRILGLPLLKHASDDLRDLARKSERAVNDLAKQNTQNKQYAVQQQGLMEQRDSYELHLKDTRSKIDAIKTRQQEVEDELGRFNEKKELLALERELKTTQYQLGQRIEEAKQNVKTTAVGLWRAVLLGRVKHLLKDIDKQVQTLEDQERMRQISRYIEQSLVEGQCKLCDNPIEPHVKEKLTRTLSSIETGMSDLPDRLAKLKTTEKLLTGMLSSSTDIIETLRDQEDKLSRLQIDMRTTTDNLTDVKDELSGAGATDTTTDLYNELTTLGQQIANYENDEEDDENKIEELTRSIDEITKKITNFSSADTNSALAKENNRMSLAREMKKAFEGAIDAYKIKLKQKVEAGASTLFKSLCAEPFERLVINDSYGLEIQNTDGTIVPLPSEGQYHLVSLAMIGALHNNAPRKGPMVMDNPVMRLDPENTSNMLTLLPQISKQIILFVKINETSPEQARATMLGNLKKEYELIRLDVPGKTVRYTKIREKLA